MIYLIFYNYYSAYSVLPLGIVYCIPTWYQEPGFRFSVSGTYYKASDFIIQAPFKNKIYVLKTIIKMKNISIRDDIIILNSL